MEIEKSKTFGVDPLEDYQRHSPEENSGRAAGDCEPPR
jgi:hypothetical protein